MTHLDSRTDDDRAVADAIERAAALHQPPPNWEARVWARALRQQTASPGRRVWLRRLVPAMAVVALLGISGALGAALWRSRSELSNVQTRVSDEKRAVEELRRDLLEAQAEASAMQVQLEALAAGPNGCGPGTIEAHMAKRREALRTKRPKLDKRKDASIKLSCNPNDPLCGL